MLMFKDFFANRCGVAWDEGQTFHDVKHLGAQGDGTGDKWLYEPPREDEMEALKGFERKPSVTMVVSEKLAGGVIDARAPTPEGGW